MTSQRLSFKPGWRFHNFIVVLDRLDLAPGWAWSAVAFLVAAAASLTWPANREPAALVTLTALLLELLVLVRSRVTKISPSPLGGPFLLFLIGHGLTTAAAGFAPIGDTWRLLLHLLVQSALLAAMYYGSSIEPLRVRLRRETVTLGDGGGPALKIFLVADLHLDRWGPREEQVLAHARAFAPDLVLMPGDFTNLSFVDDPTTREQTANLIAQLAALAPVYGSLGTPEVDERDWTRSIFDDTPARFLDDEALEVEVKGVKLMLIGVGCQGARADHGRALHRLTASAGSSPRVLLHHSPDLAEAAPGLGISLYVAGHTHGGQVRLPLAGAPYTASVFGNRYAAGTYRLGRCTLVTSQGVGLEGADAPRLRFLCPPEVVAIELRMDSR